MHCILPSIEQFAVCFRRVPLSSVQHIKEYIRHRNNPNHDERDLFELTADAFILQYCSPHKIRNLKRKTKIWNQYHSKFH